MPAASTNNIIKTSTFRSKVFWSITSSYESATRFPKPWPENQEKFLELILQKNSFGIPRCAQVTLCWLHAFSHFCTRKESEVLWDETPRARSCERIHPLVYILPLFSSPSPPLSFSPLCVFYCKLRLKSLAQSQAFHLGRCIPADTHERYVLAYVSRARTRASRSRICEEKSSYVLPAGSEVRFTYTYMIRAWIEKVSRIRSIFFSWSECRDATCLRISSDWK